MNTPGKAPGQLVAELGERGLIERIRRRLPPAPPDLVVGIGDDAAVAVVEKRALQVLTTDALVEGVHFDRRYSSPGDIGYKALAVNVSDVAAMGGTPRLALLSLMLPASFPVADVDHLLDGLVEMATASQVTLAGGNITASPGPLIVDVTVTGWVHPRRVLLRGGGRPGDVLYVSGTIGAAAAGLDWLRHSSSPGDSPPPELVDCIRRHQRPEPRVRLGVMLGRNRAASACMDLSDGLADAVRQVAEASSTGARIEVAALPIHPGAVAWFQGKGEEVVDRAVRGGDDYELLFAVPVRTKGRLRAVSRLVRGLPLTRIGELTAERTVIMQSEGGARELPPGFVHF